MNSLLPVSIIVVRVIGTGQERLGEVGVGLLCSVYRCSGAWMEPSRMRLVLRLTVGGGKLYGWADEGRRGRKYRIPSCVASEQWVAALYYVLCLLLAVIFHTPVLV